MLRTSQSWFRDLLRDPQVIDCFTPRAVVSCGSKYLERSSPSSLESGGMFDLLQHLEKSSEFCAEWEIVQWCCEDICSLVEDERRDIREKLPEFSALAWDPVRFVTSG